jgi:hypothetical protein
VWVSAGVKPHGLWQRLNETTIGGAVENVWTTRGNPVDELTIAIEPARDLAANRCAWNVDGAFVVRFA